MVRCTHQQLTADEAKALRELKALIEFGEKAERRVRVSGMMATVPQHLRPHSGDYRSGTIML